MVNAETVRKALRAVKDPELNLNIIDIGLVYDITVSDEGDLTRLSLGSRNCGRREADGGRCRGSSLGGGGNRLGTLLDSREDGPQAADLAWRVSQVKPHEVAFAASISSFPSTSRCQRRMSGIASSSSARSGF